MFDDLVLAVKELGTVDPDTLTPAELADAAVMFAQVRNQLDAIEAGMNRALEVQRVYTIDGAKTAAAWLAKRTREPVRECGRRLRWGRVAAEMPLVAAAWEAGQISAAHVGRLAAVRNDRTRAAFQRDEAMLVAHACDLTFKDFTADVAYWLQLADPDGADEAEMRRRLRRRVTLDETLSGMYSGSTLLDPVSGVVVAGELARREQELFDRDWAEAKARLGRDPLVHELARTAGQRRADALVEMARRSAAMAPGSQMPKPLFTVVVGAARMEQLCQRATGQVIAPGALTPWLQDAQLESILFDEVGLRAIKATRQRSFRGVVRRILEVRDQQCTHSYCEEPPHRCQGDHIVPYPDGGMTSQENGQLRCGFHNRLRAKRPPPNDDDDDYDDHD